MLIISMIICFIVVLAYFLCSVFNGHELNKIENKLNLKLSYFIVREEKVTVYSYYAHDVLCDLGEALDSSQLDDFDKIKNEIHPSAKEYYKRSKGLNIKDVSVNERPKLKIVK